MIFLELQSLVLRFNSLINNEPLGRQNITPTSYTQHLSSKRHDYYLLGLFITLACVLLRLLPNFPINLVFFAK